MDSNDYLKLENQLCFPLYAASRMLTQAYRPVLSRIGLTYPQYLVMMVLWEHKVRTVKALGAALYLDSGTLTPLLKKLEKMGLLKRERDSQDDRQVNNILTKEGEDLYQQALTIPQEMACSLNLEIAQAIDLKQSLDKLIDSLETSLSLQKKVVDF